MNTYKKYKDIFSISIAELNKLYRKFEIPEFYTKKDKFLLALALVNNLAPYETLKNTCEKYNIKECDKTLNAIKNAPQDNENLKKIKESVFSLCQAMNEAFNS